MPNDISSFVKFVYIDQIIREIINKITKNDIEIFS